MYEKFSYGSLTLHPRQLLSTTSKAVDLWMLDAVHIDHHQEAWGILGWLTENLSVDHNPIFLWQIPIAEAFLVHNNAFAYEVSISPRVPPSNVFRVWYHHAHAVVNSNIIAKLSSTIWRGIMPRLCQNRWRVLHCYIVPSLRQTRHVNA